MQLRNTQQSGAMFTHTQRLCVCCATVCCSNSNIEGVSDKILAFGRAQEHFDGRSRLVYRREQLLVG